MGRSNFAAAPILDATLVEALWQRPESVAIDLTEVTFFDSSGLQVLLVARNRPGALTVAATEDGPVRPLFEMTEVLGLFEVVDCLDDDWGSADAAVSGSWGD